jgi:hypothetical protein
MFGRLRLGYWAIFAIAAITVLAATTVSDRSLIRYFAFSSWERMVGIWLLPAFLWVAWLGVVIIHRGVNRPVAALRHIVVRHRFWLLRGLLFCFFLRPVASAFSILKASIPNIVPFYADGALADLDRAIFLGHDPWTLTHRLLGPFGTYLLDRFYLTWFFMMMLLLAWLCFTRDGKLQVRGLLSYILCWTLLGNAGALAFSSVGPCFYERFYGDDRFSGLLDSLRAIDESYKLMSFRTMEWLIEHREVGNLGGGISAMPSMHVAIASLFCFVAWSRTTSFWVRTIAASYLAVIWFASVHLAWHYAVDGIVSIIGVSAIWWATGRFVEFLDRQPEAVSSGVRAEPTSKAPVPV